MKFTPTVEQQNIINHCITGKDLAVKAYAGATKTSTLSMVSQELHKQGKVGLYLAFNKNTAMEANDKLKVHLNIDIKDISNFANHWFSLSEGKFPRVTHPQLIGFNRLIDVENYLEENNDKDLERYVRLVTKFGKKLFFILKNVVDLNEADCIVTTCHKVKGLEFDSVYIGDDFDLVGDDGSLTQDEMLLNLTYVAVTRGKKYVNSDSINSFFNEINK